MNENCRNISRTNSSFVVRREERTSLLPWGSIGDLWYPVRCLCPWRKEGPYGLLLLGYCTLSLLSIPLTHCDSLRLDGCHLEPVRNTFSRCLIGLWWGYGSKGMGPRWIHLHWSSFLWLTHSQVCRGCMTKQVWGTKTVSIQAGVVVVRSRMLPDASLVLLLLHNWTKNSHLLCSSHGFISCRSVGCPTLILQDSMNEGAPSFMQSCKSKQKPFTSVFE